MRMQTSEEKKSMTESLRSRYISMVNPDKSTWEELTKQEKKEVDKLCEANVSRLQF